MTLRLAGWVLAVGTIVIAIIATQWPFEYRMNGFALHVHWMRIDWRWFPHANRDLVLNLLMLMPLGAGLALARQAVRSRVLVESLAIGILSGVTLEAAQLWTHERYTSLPDAWHNAAGCVAGCAIVLAVVRRAA